jgi:hypothetical protein
MPRLVAILALACLAFAACGEDESEPASQQSTAAKDSADLTGIKSYLTDHTDALTAQTAILAENGQAYYDLAKESNFDYEAMLRENPDEVEQLLTESKDAFRKANPAYEEMEGIVAGVPRLAEYDVILDAGSSAADDPESAVPFSLELPNGKRLKQPGNFFFLVETSLFGTNEDFVAKGVEPDVDGDGKVSFGEGLPEANFYLAATRDMDKYANELKGEAAKFSPDESDALTALVIMTPTMSEYFEAWKNSRFVAGAKATEEGFVAASRLQDIADILSGLVLVYDGVEPVVRKADAQQAKQTGESLKQLHAFAAGLRDKEAAGKKYTAEEADTLGARAQDQAEAIAGQITQAAAKLNIEIQEG